MDVGWSINARQSEPFAWPCSIRDLLFSSVLEGGGRGHLHQPRCVRVRQRRVRLVRHKPGGPPQRHGAAGAGEAHRRQHTGRSAIASFSVFGVTSLELHLSLTGLGH